MKKITYFSGLILILLIFSIYLIYTKYHTDIGSFRCTAQFEQKSFSTNELDDQVKTSAFITVFFTDKNSGFFSMTGAVETKNKTYNLSRRSDFSLAPKTLHGVRMVTIIKENVNPVDSTPEDIWRQNISPGEKGIPFHMITKKIGENTLLITSLSFPLLICVIPED